MEGLKELGRVNKTETNDVLRLTKELMNNALGHSEGVSKKDAVKEASNEKKRLGDAESSNRGLEG